MNPIILCENKLVNAALTASGTYSGYDVENVLDQRNNTYWKDSTDGGGYIQATFANAVAIDCIGVCGHNLFACGELLGATIDIKYSDDGVNWSVAASYVPIDDNAFMIKFTSATKKYWRLQITDINDYPMIAVLFMGTAIQFEYPPDGPIAVIDEGINANEEMSKGGNFLGAVVNYNDMALARTFSNFTFTFYNSYFKPFWDSYGKLKSNFFYADDLTNAQVYYCRFTNDFRLQPQQNNTTAIESLTINCIAVR